MLNKAQGETGVYVLQKEGSATGALPEAAVYQATDEMDPRHRRDLDLIDPEDIAQHVREYGQTHF